MSFVDKEIILAFGKFGTVTYRYVPVDDDYGMIAIQSLGGEDYLGTCENMKVNVGKQYYRCITVGRDVLFGINEANIEDVKDYIKQDE